MSMLDQEKGPWAVQSESIITNHMDRSRSELSVQVSSPGKVEASPLHNGKHKDSVANKSLSLFFPGTKL